MVVFSKLENFNSENIYSKNSQSNYIKNVPKNTDKLKTRSTSNFISNCIYNFLFNSEMSGSQKEIEMSKLNLSFEKGFGKSVYLDGSNYEGFWENYKYHGLGVYTSSDGSRYEGNWAHGKQNGVGIYLEPDGYKYFGSWVDGKHSGWGAEKSIDKSDSEVFYSIYQGAWSYGKKEGWACLRFFDGSIFEGILESSTLRGFVGWGSYTWLNENGIQQFYDGQWRFGCRVNEYGVIPEADKLKKITFEKKRGEFKLQVDSLKNLIVYARGEYFRTHYQKIIDPNFKLPNDIFHKINEFLEIPYLIQLEKQCNYKKING